MDMLPAAVENLSAPNIIAHVRHAWLDECAVRAMRKKMKLSSDCGDSGSKKCKRGYSGLRMVSCGLGKQIAKGSLPGYNTLAWFNPTKRDAEWERRESGGGGGGKGIFWL
jgi:hypothetical protein